MKFQKGQQNSGFFTSQKQPQENITARKYFVSANSNCVGKLQRQKPQQPIPFQNALISKQFPAKKVKKKKKVNNPKKKVKKQLYSLSSDDNFQPIQKSYPNTHYASVYKDIKKLDINIISPGKYCIDQSILQQPNWRLQHRRKRNAAVKIQKVFRGYLVRKNLSRIENGYINYQFEDPQRCQEQQIYQRQQQHYQSSQYSISPQKQWINQCFNNKETPYYSGNYQTKQLQHRIKRRQLDLIKRQSLPIQISSQEPSSKKQASTHQKSANIPQKCSQQIIEQIVQSKNFNRQLIPRRQAQSKLFSLSQIRKLERQRWDDVINMINDKMIEQNEKHNDLQHWFQELLVISKKNKQDLNDTMLLQNGTSKLDRLPFFGKQKEQLKLKRQMKQQYDPEINLLEQISEIDCSYHKDYPLLLKTYKKNQFKRLKQSDLLIELLQFDPLLAQVKDIHKQLEDKKVSLEFREIQKLHRNNEIDSYQEELRIQKINKKTQQNIKNRDILIKNVMQGNKSLYILEQQIFQNLNKCGIKVKGCSSQGNLKIKKFSKMLSNIIIDQLHGYQLEKSMKKQSAPKYHEDIQQKNKTQNFTNLLPTKQLNIQDNQRNQYQQNKQKYEVKQENQRAQAKQEQQQEKYNNQENKKKQVLLERQQNQEEEEKQERPQKQQKFQQFYKQPSFFNFKSKNLFTQQSNCLISIDEPCQPLQIPINIGWKKKNESNSVFSKRFTKISLIPAPKETIMLQSDSDQQHLSSVKNNQKQSITQLVLFQILKEVSLQLFFKAKIISKFNLSKYSFPLVSHQTKMSYLDHVEKMLPSYDVMLNRMNQKFVPNPLDRLRIFRTCIDQEQQYDANSDDACFEQIGHYEPIIDPQLCQIAFQSFYKGIEQTQEFYQHIRANELNLNSESKQIIDSRISLIDIKPNSYQRLIQQREKETHERKKLNKQLKKEFLNIEVHALFQAWNQQLLFLVLPIKTVSGIGLRQLQISLKPHQSMITSKRSAVRLIYESKKQIQEIIQDQRDLAEKQLLQNYQLMCLDSNWISYSQDALHLFCQLIFLLEQTLFAEAALDILGKEHFLGYLQ